jgi:uncharacterized membrane protein
MPIIDSGNIAGKLPHVLHYSKTLPIDAAPETVFKVLCDVEHWPQWTPTMTSITRRDTGPFKVGSSALVRQPKLRPALWTVDALEANRNFTWVSASPGVHSRAAHRVEPAGGGCRITLSFEVDGWLSFLVKSMYGKLIDEYIATEASSLKRYCEQER